MAVENQLNESERPSYFRDPKKNPNYVRVFSSEGNPDELVKSDGLLSRMMNYLGYMAGLHYPLTTRDYNRFFTKYKSDDDIWRRELSNHLISGTGNILHSNTWYDVYTLMKDASIAFIITITMVYFLLISTAAAGFYALSDCADIPLASYIPTGFFLISGLNGGLDHEPICMWIETLAVLTGVYLSIPILGATVLVRLLDNGTINFEVSNRVLLTVRNGKPVLMIRMLTNNGQVHSHPRAEMFVANLSRDEQTGDSYSELIILNLQCPPLLTYMPAIATHTCEAEDPLLTKGLILMDEQGVPSWNYSKIGILGVTFYADKSPNNRSSMVSKVYTDLRYHLVHRHDVTGAVPSYVSCVVYTVSDWVKSGGKNPPTSDLSKINDFRYSEKMTRDYELGHRKSPKPAEKPWYECDDDVDAVDDGGRARSPTDRVEFEDLMVSTRSVRSVSGLGEESRASIWTETLPEPPKSSEENRKDSLSM